MFFIIIPALILTLISSVVMADIVPTPKSITFVCDDNVKKGTIVLTNPPTFSCEDYETITSVIGTGIIVGPDTRVEEISSAIRDITGNQLTRRWPVSEPSQACSKPWDSKHFEKFPNDNYREQNPENSKNPFYGISRNKKWFNESGRGAWIAITGDEISSGHDNESGEWKAITGDDNETRQYRRRSAQGRKRFQ